MTPSMARRSCESCCSSRVYLYCGETGEQASQSVNKRFAARESFKKKVEISTSSWPLALSTVQALRRMALRAALAGQAALLGAGFAGYTWYNRKPGRKAKTTTPLTAERVASARATLWPQREA